MTECLGYGSAVFALIAALLWLWSALVKLPSDASVITTHRNPSEDVPYVEVVSIGSSPGLEKLASALKFQSRLSSFAAFSAAIAAILQVAAQFAHV